MLLRFEGFVRLVISSLNLSDTHGRRQATVSGGRTCLSAERIRDGREMVRYTSRWRTCCGVYVFLKGGSDCWIDVTGRPCSRRTLMCAWSLRFLFLYLQRVGVMACPV